MSRPNVINTILREMATQCSLEEAKDPVLTDSVVLNQTLEGLCSQINTLLTIRSEMVVSRGATRQQAMTLESIEGVKLPFSSRGYTIQPSPTGLRLTVESIGKRVGYLMRELYDLLMKLLKNLRDQFFGNQRRAERTRDEMKKARRDVKEAARDKIDDDSIFMSNRQLAILAKRVWSLAERSDFYKAVCNDLRLYNNVRLLLEQIETPDQQRYFGLERQLHFAGLDQFAKKFSEELYPESDRLPLDRKVLAEVLRRGSSTPNRALEGLLVDGEIHNIRDFDLFLDRYFDKAMSTLGVIDNAVMAALNNLKEIERQAIKMRSSKELSPEAVTRMRFIMRHIQAFNQLATWLMSVQTVSASLAEEQEKKE